MKDEFLGAMIFSPPCWDFWYQFKNSLSSETIDISQVEIKRSYLFYFYCWQNMLGKHSLELSIIGLPTCKTLCQNFPCSRSQEEQLDSYWPPFIEVEWVLSTWLSKTGGKKLRHWQEGELRGNPQPEVRMLHDLFLQLCERGWLQAFLQILPRG